MIKVTAKNKPTDDKPEYPCLMEYSISGVIIIATGKNGDAYIGTCIKVGSSTRKIGADSKDWSRLFKPYHGSITLENEE